jgi:hypothetical protein
VTTYRYYVLECDACGAYMGRNSDPGHPGRGITICGQCWSDPAHLPNHLKSSITLDQAQSAVGTSGSDER